jgi:hypothetical protein
MVKKKFFPIVLLTVLTILLTGCFEKKSSNDLYPIEFNTISMPVILAPEKAYFDDEIIFKISSIDDAKSYVWDFDDGTTVQGKRVNHKFDFINDLNIKYPLIYTVKLFMIDGGYIIGTTIHQIKLYPNKFILYLESGKLTTNKPAYSIEPLKKDKISNMPQISYTLKEPILIPKCRWNASIYFNKPFLSIFTKFSICFLDKHQNIIAEKEKRIGLNTFWNEKMINLQGDINEKFELSSLKISVSSLSLLNDIKIVYGDEKTSKITFNFFDKDFKNLYI